MRRRVSVLLSALLVAGAGLSISATPGGASEKVERASVLSQTRAALTASLAKSELSDSDRVAVEEILDGFIRNFTRMVAAGTGDRSTFDQNFDRRIAPKLQGYGLDSESFRPLLQAVTEAALKATSETDQATAERER